MQGIAEEGEELTISNNRTDKVPCVTTGVVYTIDTERLEFLAKMILTCSLTIMQWVCKWKYSCVHGYQSKPTLVAHTDYATGYRGCNSSHGAGK